MRILHYSKYVFIVVSVTIFTAFILDNKNITKPILVLGYILIFLVPIINNYEKKRISSHSHEEKRNQSTDLDK